MNANMMCVARVLLAAVLMTVPGFSSACLHGANGTEQTSIVDGPERIDRLNVSAKGGTLAKVFVADADAAVDGLVLPAEMADVHAQLARIAAGIDSEGTKGSRGGGKVAFAGSGVTGEHFVLDAKQFPDWKSVMAKTGVKSEGSKHDKFFTDWLAAVRTAGRTAHILTTEVPAGKNDLSLAVKIVYAGGDDTAKRIMVDKMLETASGNLLNITWFMKLSNTQAARQVELAGGEPRGESSPDEKNFGYTWAAGTADVRVRGGDIAYKGASKAVSGIVWMK